MNKVSVVRYLSTTQKTGGFLRNPPTISLNGALRRKNQPQNAHIVVYAALFRPIYACTASVDQARRQVPIQPKDSNLEVARYGSSPAA